MSKNIKESKEIEARWINLDASEMVKRLKKIGAKKTGDFFFREWIFSYDDWVKDNRRIRVRTDGVTTWLTYKSNATWAIDSTEEMEVTVSSAEETVKLLRAIGITQRRIQEKKRQTFTLGDITFDIDFWPKIPMVFEIEGPSEKKVKEGAKLVGLDWNDAIFVDQAWVHKNYYNIDLFKITDYRFD